MEEVPVHVIRESTRNLIKFIRRQNRDEKTDLQRSLCNNFIILSDEVQEIANKLKTKASVTAYELRGLKNALVNDDKNINRVLNTHGALRGIIRELSGVDVNKQCEAAGCICNLSLGDSRSGAVVAKASGPYLIAKLDNMSSQLAVTCAWAVGNLAGSGRRACGVLVAGGAAGKLATLASAPNRDLRDAAVYALLHLAHHLNDDLSNDHVTRILSALSDMSMTETATRLLFTLSCHRSFVSEQNLTDKFLQKILQDMNKMCVEKSFFEKSACFTYLVRTLANMDCDVYTAIVNYFTENKFDDSFKTILCSDNHCMRESLLWLLGNLYKYHSDSNFFKKL